MFDWLKKTMFVSRTISNKKPRYTSTIETPELDEDNSSDEEEFLSAFLDKIMETSKDWKLSNDDNSYLTSGCSRTYNAFCQTCSVYYYDLNSCYASTGERMIANITYFFPNPANKQEIEKWNINMSIFLDKRNVLNSTIIWTLTTNGSINSYENSISIETINKVKEIKDIIVNLRKINADIEKKKSNKTLNDLMAKISNGESHV